MALDALRSVPGGLAEFRVDAPHEIAVLLRQLQDGNVPLFLHASGGSAVQATVWTADAARASIGLAIDPGDPALYALLECPEVAVVAYLDSVKLQFDLHDLVLVRGPQASVLSGAFPREVFRFQRRDAYRVRPPLHSTPTARLRHTDIGEMQLALRVLDVSLGGCALLLPADVPPMQLGGVINQVQIELDADTRFHVALRLQHITALGGTGDARGVRLGCEFVGAEAAALRSLQRFVDQTQKRGRLFGLG